MSLEESYFKDLLCSGYWDVTGCKYHQVKVVLFLERKCTFKCHLNDFAFPGKKILDKVKLGVKFQRVRASLDIDALKGFLRDGYFDSIVLNKSFPKRKTNKQNWAIPQFSNKKGHFYWIIELNLNGKLNKSRDNSSWK